MNVAQLLAEVENLDENALEQLKQQIARREEELHAQQRQRTPEEWAALTRDFLDDFWADTDEEEKGAILGAIREKNKPRKKDL